MTTIPISLDKLLTGQLKFMGNHDFDVYMVSSWDDKVPALEKREQSKFVTVNMTRTISPLKDILSLCKLVIIFSKLRPQIVHTHTPKAGLLGMLAAWMVKVPVRLHTVAGLPLTEKTGFKRMILEWVEQLTYGCAVKVYPNSDSLRKFIIENNFCAPEKLKVIGNGSSNGIDANHFKLDFDLLEKSKKLKNEFGITGENFVFIFAGRIVKDKGVEELTRAFSNLNIIYPNLRLLLVGPLEPELDPLSAQCMNIINDNKNIITTGFKNDIRPYFVMSHALVFPSYREGFPNVPLQAGCFDLPSIVTNINGCNEIVRDRENGLIIPVKNTEALQKAMELMINDEMLYLHTKGNARKIVTENYGQEKVWEELLLEYQYHLKLKNIVQ